MIDSHNKTLGIIFPNTYDALIPELTNVRLMASVPFASRYRLIDFVLSSMSNCGIDDIYIMANRNYHSLLDHLGSGRDWDLVRKNGGLNILPPFAIETSKQYTGRVTALAGILELLRHSSEKYVLISDSNIACNFDFNKMIAEHEKVGADVSVAYNVQEFPASIKESHDDTKGFYYTLRMGENGRVTNIHVNDHCAGLQNFSMNIYLIERELLIELINTAFVRGMQYLERDVLLPQLDKLNVHGYKFEGYVARISDLKSYFDENMKLLNDKNLDALFGGSHIYTKIRDDNPTRYITGAKVENTMAADGCIIEGEVENSVLFRGVKIGKGAKIKNCILMQDTVVEAGAELEYVITDKNVTITAGKSMKGEESLPVYIGKYKIV